MLDETTGGGSGDGGNGGGGGDKPNPVAANVKLRDKAEPITVDGLVNAGMNKNPIQFPSAENQREGWYHPRAAEILALFPERYVEVKPLGK